MIEATAKLNLTSPLLEAIKSGVRVVLPVNGSIAAQVAVPAIIQLLRELEAPPPLLAYSQSGPNSTPAADLALGGAELYPVETYGNDLAAYVRQRWAQQLKAVTELRQLELTSPWPSFTRPGCIPALQMMPLIRTLTADFKGRAVILANWGPQRIDLPDPLPSTGIIQWAPTRIDDPMALLADHVPDLNTPVCRVCRLCPIANAGHTQSMIIAPGDPAMEALTALESETTFPFRNGQWLAELQSASITAAQAGRHRTAVERAARRQAASYLLPSDHLLTGPGGAPRAPTMEECSDIAVQRKILSEILSVALPYTTPTEVRAALSLSHADHPPIALSALLAASPNSSRH